MHTIQVTHTTLCSYVHSTLLFRHSRSRFTRTMPHCQSQEAEYKTGTGPGNLFKKKTQSEQARDTNEDCDLPGLY